MAWIMSVFESGPPMQRNRFPEGSAFGEEQPVTPRASAPVPSIFILQTSRLSPSDRTKRRASGPAKDGSVSIAVDELVRTRVVPPAVEARRSADAPD
jgi:hypothetical protein